MCRVKLETKIESNNGLVTMLISFIINCKSSKWNTTARLKLDSDR